MAVSQIRRSSGQLRGLGLAVFDGLLFPLLVLDVAIAWCWFGIANLVFNFTPGTVEDPLAQSLLIAFRIGALLSMALVDWSVIRSVWRAVTGKARRHPSHPSAA
jgi:hypothetical protein